MRWCSAIAICAAALLLSGASVWSADKKDPDWPCVQHKVPTISVGMIWAGPPPGEEAGSQWRSQKDVAELVPRLAARRTTLDEAEALIEDYASKLGKEDRARKLTLLFTGILERINAEREQIIAGIERFTRKQRVLAKTIGKIRVELNEVLKIAQPSNAEKERRREIETKLGWQTRIHLEREQALQYVCESPVLLEQRAFAIARAIMNHLE